MADPVWGSLAKAQDDPQTISEAIAAAITAHEADPSAHLDTGQSLEVHRSNDVLDHPLGSVLADKNTQSEIVFSEPFVSLSNLNVIGSVSLSNYPQVEFDSVYPSDPTSSIYLPVEVVADWVTYDHDWLIQFVARVNDIGANAVMWWGEGFNGGVSGDGFGFVYDSGTYYAQSGFSGDSQRVPITGVDFTAGHIFRVQYSVTDGVVYFFIDGVQVASITPGSLTGGTDIGPSFGAHTTATIDETDFYLSNLVYARSLN